MADLPEPLTPPDCDLRGLPYMPLDVVRLVDSDLFALSTGAEFKAAVALWCKSWLQKPSGSLPNEDRVLAHLSGANSHWCEVRETALRGWVLCSDGRLYHPVVCEKANVAWSQRLKQRTNGKKGGRPRGSQPKPKPPAPPRHPIESVSEKPNGKAKRNPAETHGITGGLDENRFSKKQEKYKGKLLSESVGESESPLPRESTDRRPDISHMPTLADPPGKWIALGLHENTEIKSDANLKPVHHACISGERFQDVCRIVCDAAGIADQKHRDDWTIVAGWLRECGYQVNVERDILGPIRNRMRQGSTPNIWTVGYFTRMLREHWARAA